MPLEQLLRDELHSITQTVPRGPDLDRSLRQGRRRRRLVATAAVAGSAAAVAALAMTVSTLVPSSDHASTNGADEHVSAEHLAYPDHVAGTDIDKTMQETVSKYVPWVGAATNVYPSDWTRNDALPDSDFAMATDWQATYDLGAHETLLLVMGFNPPDDPVRPGCDAGSLRQPPAAPECHTNSIAGGVVTSSGYSVAEPDAEGSDTYTFITSYQTPDGFTVNALDRVLAGSWAAANAMRELDEVTLTQLVTDPSLSFPEPIAWPK